VAAPKKESACRRREMQGTRQEYTKSVTHFQKVGAWGEREEKERKCPNNLMARLEESIYSYSRTLQQKAFPGCTVVPNTDIALRRQL